MSGERVVAFSMTIDPEGAMHDWVDVPEGWTLLPVPTQELVLAVGIAAYQRILVDLAERERVDLLVTHPPYDYLDEATAVRLRAAGAAVVGYAFDDEIFGHLYGADTRGALARVYDRYLTTREVRWATRPLPAVTVSDIPDCDVVLVGRAYARREALVAELRRAGLEVWVRGNGWPAGFASRKEMLGLYGRAAVVLTTADWEDVEVPMVKHRLLDTAMLGVFQIAQEAPDLRGYFSEEEVPSYRDAAELVAKVQAFVGDAAGRRRAAAAARDRALREHTWKTRFFELISGVRLRERQTGVVDMPTRPGSLDLALIALATRAEADGRIGAAAAMFETLLARDPAEPTAAAGLGRCLRDLGEPERALPYLRLAAAAPSPPCAAALHAGIPRGRAGTGLGRLGLFPPAAEAQVFLVAALMDLGRVDEAAAVLDRAAADPPLARALGETLRGDALPPEIAIRLAHLRGE